MKKVESRINPSVNRRSFLKTGMLAGSAATVGAVLAGSPKPAFAQGDRLTDGDIAILRFLATAELIEADLWQQYAELGGLTSGQPIEVDMNQTLNSYQAALSNLDGDGPQYITSNTNDEISHANFLNAYLESRGAEAVNLDQFRTLQGSTASMAAKTKRLTNLMHLNVDTSWFTRYRSVKQSRLWRYFPASCHHHQPYRYPQIRRRSERERRSYSGDRQHRGLSLRIHRARWFQPLCDYVQESYFS